MTLTMYPPPTPRRNKPVAKRIRDWVLLIIAFLSLHSALNAEAQNVNLIDRADVYAYWDDYYFPTVIDNPPQALEKLTTENFKRLAVGKPDQYAEFWNRVERVKDLTVSDPLQGLGQQNKFDVHWVYYYKNDPKPHPVTVRTHMTCSSVWRAYAPLGQCNSGDLRLDDSQRVPKR